MIELDFYTCHPQKWRTPDRIEADRKALQAAILRDETEGLIPQNELIVAEISGSFGGFIAKRVELSSTPHHYTDTGAVCPTSNTHVNDMSAAVYAACIKTCTVFRSGFAAKRVSA